MSQLDKQLDQHIRNTTHYDNDYRFMAVDKLAKLISTHHKTIAENRMVEIVDSILNHFDSDEKALHNNAIKCLGDIITRLSNENCRRVVDRMVARIAKPETKQMQELIDIYANGLVAIVKDVGYECGYQLKDLVKVTVDAIYEIKKGTTPLTSDKSIETELALVNVAEAFISKWPKIIDAIEFDKAEFVKYLLGNIGNSKLSKRSYLCLGALAQSLREKELMMVLTENGGIISKIKSQSNYEKKKDYYYALAACLKGKSLFLANLVPEVFKFIFGEIKGMASNEEIVEEEEGLELISKLLDSLISSLNSVVQGFPGDFKELTENLTKDLVHELKLLIVYSPSAYITYLSSGQEEEGEEQGDEEVQTDSSYLVRASALELVGFLSSINPKLCEIFIDCPDLFKSLKEEKIEVRNASFSMFENLFIGISKEEGGDIENELPGLRREISVFKEKVPPLLVQILKQLEELLKNPKIILLTRIGCVRLLRQIPRTFLFTLSNDHKLGLVDKLYELTLSELRKSKVLEVEVILVNAVECLARYRHIKYSLDSVSILIPMIKSSKNENLYRAAFAALANHLCEGYEGLSKSTQTLEEVSNLAEKFSSQTNLEQTARIAINETILMLINHYYSILSESTLERLLRIILDKLSSETNKIHILNGIKTLPTSFKVTSHTKELLTQIAISIAANLINNKLTAVKQGAQLSILAILQILGNSFEHAAQLLKLSDSLIDSREFPEYLIELANLFPKLFEKIINRLLNLQGVHPCVVAGIIKNNNIQLNQLVSLIKINLTPENLIYCIDILATIGVKVETFETQIADTLWGSLCLRLLGLSSNEKYFDRILGFAASNFKSKTRENARLALGDLAATHLASLLPRLVSEFQKTKQDDMDLTFVSLQQCISKSDSKSYDVIEGTVNQLVLMIESNRIQNESVINRVGQSVARLYNVNPTRGAKLLLNLASSKSENVRFLFATAISSIDLHLFNADVINQLINLYAVDTLKLKTVSAKSLSYLINVNPIEMQPFISTSLFESIKASAWFNEKLVITEVIGAKTTTDTGKPLRIQSFFLAEEILSKRIFSGLDLVEFVRMALSIGNDYYDDVLLHRLDLIRLATEISSKSLLALETEFVDQLSLTGKVLKNYVKEDDDEVTRKISLNLARKILDILGNCKKENSLILENYAQQLKALPKFKSLVSEDDE